MAKHKGLNEIAQRETMLFRRQKSRFFLECATSLMAHDYGVDEVVQMLREYADQLELLR